MSRYWFGTIFLSALLLVVTVPKPMAADDDSPEISFQYSFETPLSPDDAVQTIFGFKHLKAYSRGVHQLTQSHRKPNSHVALYEYRHAMFRTVIMFKRTLYSSKNEVGIKMLSCWDNVPFLPELTDLDGRYTVSVNKAGKTVVHYRTVSRFKDSPGRAYRKILLQRSMKFLGGLKEYLQKPRK